MSTDITPFEKICESVDAGESDPDRHIMNQVNASIAKAVKATKGSGKASKVTVVIDLKPAAENRVVAGVKVDAKLPNPPTCAVTLFTDPDSPVGGLYSEDPRQRKLSFHSITTKKDA